MAEPEINPRPGTEPELHLLFAQDSFEEPLWKSLSRKLDEFFFPKKLPPLQLESKPIPVKDIWGFYDYKKNGALGSTIAHILLLGVIIGVTILGRRVVTQVVAQRNVTPLVDPGDIPPLRPSKTQAGGGGGPGNPHVLEGTQPKVAKLAIYQNTSPLLVMHHAP